MLCRCIGSIQAGIECYVGVYALYRLGYNAM